MRADAELLGDLTHGALAGERDVSFDASRDEQGIDERPSHGGRRKGRRDVRVRCTAFRDAQSASQHAEQIDAARAELPVCSRDAPCGMPRGERLALRESQSLREGADHGDNDCNSSCNVNEPP